MLSMFVLCWSWPRLKCNVMLDSRCILINMERTLSWKVYLPISTICKAHNTAIVWPVLCCGIYSEKADQMTGDMWCFPQSLVPSLQWWPHVPSEQWSQWCWIQHWPCYNQWLCCCWILEFQTKLREDFTINVVMILGCKYKGHNHKGWAVWCEHLDF